MPGTISIGGVPTPALTPGVRLWRKEKSYAPVMAGFKLHVRNVAVRLFMRYFAWLSFYSFCF